MASPTHNLWCADVLPQVHCTAEGTCIVYRDVEYAKAQQYQAVQTQMERYFAEAGSE